MKKNTSLLRRRKERFCCSAAVITRPRVHSNRTKSPCLRLKIIRLPQPMSSRDSCNNKNQYSCGKTSSTISKSKARRAGSSITSMVGSSRGH